MHVAEGAGVQAGPRGWCVPFLILSHFGERRHPLVCLSDHRHHGPSVAIPHLVSLNTSFLSSLSPVGGRVLAVVASRAIHRNPLVSGYSNAWGDDGVPGHATGRHSKAASGSSSRAGAVPEPCSAVPWPSAHERLVGRPTIGAGEAATAGMPAAPGGGLREATGGLATARRPHFYAQRGSRVPKSHTTRTAPGVHTHRSRAASPSPIHRLATVKEQPQLDRGAQ